jgi:chitodextrinase
VKTKTIENLTNGTPYTYTVKAVDTAGNKSAGASVTATPVAPVNDFDLTNMVTAPAIGEAPTTTDITTAQYTGLSPDKKRTEPRTAGTLSPSQYIRPSLL